MYAYLYTCECLFVNDIILCNNLVRYNRNNQSKPASKMVSLIHSAIPTRTTYQPSLQTNDVRTYVTLFVCLNNSYLSKILKHSYINPLSLQTKQLPMQTVYILVKRFETCNKPSHPDLHCSPFCF